MGELSAPLTFKQFGKKGELVSETSISSSFFKTELANDEVSKVTIEGDAEIFEIIAQPMSVTGGK